jgi:hypothetical protein
MKIDWFWMIIFIVMMGIIGFVVFDNIGAPLAFGIFGIVFSSKKTKKISSDYYLLVLCH